MTAKVIKDKQGQPVAIASITTPATEKASNAAQIDELQERLTSLEAEQLKTENAELRLSKVLAGQLLRALLRPCEACGCTLISLNLNSACFILACNHPACRNYRTPVGTLDKAEVESVIGERLPRKK